MPSKVTVTCDFTHTSLLSLAKRNTIIHKAIVKLLKHHLLLLIEPKILHIIIKNLNLLEEFRIHEDIVRMN